MSPGIIVAKTIVQIAREIFCVTAKINAVAMKAYGADKTKVPHEIRFLAK